MTYQRFEDLPVWNAAQDMGVSVYALVKDRGFSDQGDLADQLRRAALSVSNNVAEGFERGSTAELIAYLYIARGSAGEVRSALRFARRLVDRGLLKSQMSDLKSQIDALIPHCESISRQLRAWADSLQNSEIKGQRHLTDASRLEHDQRQRAAEFLRHLRAKYPRPGMGQEPEAWISDFRFEI